MIPTSDAYQAGIFAPGRTIRPKVEIYFDEEPLVLDENMIETLSIQEEIRSDYGDIVGNVTINELDLALRNDERLFTPTNSESPYHDKIKPGVMIKVYLGLVLGEGIEYVPMGVFYTTEWDATGASVTANVKAQDLIGLIGENELPALRAITDITVYDLLTDTARSTLAAELARYGVDIDLNLKDIKLQTVFFSSTKLSDVLAEISKAANCYITTDRYGQIKVYSNYTHSLFVQVWDDTSEILTAYNKHDYTKVYSYVKVKYLNAGITDVQQIYQATGVTISSGSMKYDFTLQEPVFDINNIVLSNAAGLTIEKISYGASTLSIVIANTGAEKTVDVTVYGRNIVTAEMEYTSKDEEIASIIGDRTFTLESELLQDSNYIANYATALVWFLSEPNLVYSISARGDMSLELGDVISIKDPTEQVPRTDVQIVSQNFKYDGGLEVSITAMKPLTPVDWVYMHPGFYAQAQRQIDTADWVYVSPGLYAYVERNLEE